MWSLVAAIGVAFGVVFVAELGDKTQLLALGFGARHRLGTVAIGLALGYAAAGAAASVVGGVLGATMPERPIAIAAGLLFLAVAAWTLRGGRSVGDDGEARRTVRRRGTIASIALTIAAAEMGDKTQLATVALAARNDPVGTWIGATAGAVAAGMIGAVAGRTIGARVDERTLRIASSVLFAGFGVLLLVTA